MSIYYLLIAASILAGPALALAVVLRPRLFWPIFIVTAVLGVGPKIQGHGVVDEYWLGCLLSGALIGFMLRGRWSLASPSPGADRLHRAWFLVFCGVMVVQSLRGWAYLDDWRMIRFVAMFVALGLLGMLASSRLFPVPSGRAMVRLVAWSCLAYFVLYILVGLVVPAREGIVSSSEGAQVGRYDLQYYGWSGTTVGVFPAFVGIPAAVLCLRAERRTTVWLGWALAAAVLLTAFFYDSRTLLLGIAAYGLFSVRAVGLRRLSVVAAGLLVAGLLVFGFGRSGPMAMERARKIAGSLHESLQLFSDETRESDMGRKVDAFAAWRALVDDPGRAFWGAGWYTHRYVIVPYTRQVASDYGLDIGSNADIRRPAAFSAYAVDTGALGLVLLGAGFLLTAREILRGTPYGGRRLRGMLLLSLAMAGGSMLVAQTYDLVLFYACLMPSGVLVQLGRGDCDERRSCAGGASRGEIGHLGIEA